MITVRVAMMIHQLESLARWFLSIREDVDDVTKGGKIMMLTEWTDSTRGEVMCGRTKTGLHPSRESFVTRVSYTPSGE